MKTNCCQTQYDNMFDQKRAQQELENYHQKGIKKTTRPIVKALNKLPVEQASLLDIGGGIGTISFELFKKGIKEATHIDISQAYITLFLKEAERQSLRHKVTAQQGDFIAIQEEIPKADLVTLDKVICCYEDYETLVTTSLAKAKKWYAYCVPRNIWWVRWGQKIGDWFFRLKGRKFQTFIHPTKSIEDIIIAAGFKKREELFNKQWLIAVFEKEF